MTDWQKLEQIIAWTGLSTNAFAMSIGLKRAENLYQIKRGNNGISKELAEQITRKYPTVSRAWLLTGCGESFTNSATGGTSLAADNESGIAVYNIDNSQLLSAHPWAASTPLYYISIPTFSECDFAVTTHGDAMAPEIPSGSIVALRVITLDRLIPGEIYMVVTNDFVALRNVRFNPTNSSELLLSPANRTSYDEMTLPREAVYRLYLVKGIVINRVF